ncbi:unnamed protein product [Amoebophrya sp. A120]|nr:unnamed protein product [Amoebophrya sp. A120]|eukprot:GSA120T00016528001.1
MRVARGLRQYNTHKMRRFFRSLLPSGSTPALLTDLFWRKPCLQQPLLQRRFTSDSACHRTTPSGTPSYLNASLQHSSAVRGRDKHPLTRLIRRITAGNKKRAQQHHARLFTTDRKSQRDFYDVTPPSTTTATSSLADDIEHNPTAFGKILRNEKPAEQILYEDTEFLAFKNIKPYAPLAGLIIPKRRVRQDPMNLPKDDFHLNLVEKMRAIGLKLARKHLDVAAVSRRGVSLGQQDVSNQHSCTTNAKNTNASGLLPFSVSEKPDFDENDFWLKFHLPPYNTVDHLHLHVLAPVSQIRKWHTITIFTDPAKACDVADVLDRLRNTDNESSPSNSFNESSLVDLLAAILARPLVVSVFFFV